MSGRVLAIPLRAESAPCPYLADHESRFEHGLLLEYDEESFCRLLEAGFRHFGRYFFRPACPGPPGADWCGACVPLRVDVTRFRPSRDQRRVLRRAAAVTMEVGPPQYSEEKFEIYRRHKERFRQAGVPAAGSIVAAGQGSIETIESAESFHRSFYEGGAFTRECVYRLEGRMIAFSFLDLAGRAASSIYCCFDPAAAALSPGTLSALREIELARSVGIPWYYLGYWIGGNRSMRYKMAFRPCEIFDGRRWRPFRDAAGRYATDPEGLCIARPVPLFE